MEGREEGRKAGREDYIFSDGIVWPLLFLLIAISYTCDYDGAEETILYFVHMHICRPRHFLLCCVISSF